MMANDEMFTPKWIFNDLGLTFDLDVASSHNPYVVVPTKHKFTIDDDALIQEWDGLVWMNPPFSGVTPWVEKWLNHKNGFCLVPLSSNGKWVNTLWESDAELVYLPANMKFIGGQDGKMVAHRWRCALWAIGDQAIEALQKSGIGKVR
jgi:hypothetical protein